MGEGVSGVRQLRGGPARSCFCHWSREVCVQVLALKSVLGYWLLRRNSSFWGRETDISRESNREAWDWAASTWGKKVELKAELVCRDQVMEDRQTCEGQGRNSNILSMKKWEVPGSGPRFFLLIMFCFHLALVSARMHRLTWMELGREQRGGHQGAVTQSRSWLTGLGGGTGSFFKKQIRFISFYVNWADTGGIRLSLSSLFKTYPWVVLRHQKAGGQKRGISNEIFFVAFKNFLPF